jgi:hypothetical protein
LKVRELAALIANVDQDMPVGIAYDSMVCIGEIGSDESEGLAIIVTAEGPLLTFCAASTDLDARYNDPEYAGKITRLY